MPWFQSQQHDYRLVITKDEYLSMLNVAASETTNNVFAVPLSVPFQFNPNGLVELEEETVGARTSTNNETFLGLSQETSVATHVDTDPEPFVILSNDTHNNYVSQLEMIHGKLKHYPSLAREFQIKFADLMSDFGHKMRQQKDKTNDKNGEYVSLFPKSDTALRCVRLKSGYEPCKRRKGKDTYHKSAS
jgi:hypothetical protein